MNQWFAERMNSNRFHDRQSFFKHTSASTAKIVLAGRKLRWTMPKIFNDPFDVPNEILEGIDEQSLRQALVDRMNDLVVKPTLPYPQHHSMTTRLLLQMFSLADDKLKKELIAGTKESLNDPTTTSEGLRLMREQWRGIHGEQRILCFTERWDSASMWDRYSQKHTGVLLEFACLDHRDSAWLIAKRVNYSDEPLRCNTVEGLAELMFYDPHYVAAQIMEEYTHTKTTDWAYEKEWRIASWKRPYESGDYSDYEFLPEELIGITFGASITDEDRTDLSLMLKAQFPHVKIWQASIGAGRQLTREIQSNSEQDSGGNA